MRVPTVLAIIVASAALAYLLIHFTSLLSTLLPGIRAMTDSVSPFLLSPGLKDSILYAVSGGPANLVPSNESNL